MHKRITRRRAVAGISGSLLLPLGVSARTPGAVAASTFAHGVASGDPDLHSVVLWTRVSGVDAEVTVEWEVALDAYFQERVSGGFLRTSDARDYTVKVLAEGLEAGRRYYYRFRAGDRFSPVGRARTLPRGALSKLTLAVVSCSNFPFGYFNAYQAIALDESVDWVLHLGDYLYEYGPDGYGGETGRNLDRNHEPPREILSLADYRERHAQYKGDTQSQQMHAAHSLLAIWDDHESANNPWMEGAENHQPDTEGSWAARRDAAVQAYFEWMPIREPAAGHAREDYWRSWRFGDLATMVTLETRHSGRARQIEYSEHPDARVDPDAAGRFLSEVVGAPDRPMLSGPMEDFLRRRLRETADAEIPWKILANQIPMARTFNPRISAEDIGALQGTMSDASFARLQHVAGLGALGLPLYLDPWDGYPWAREEFYRLCAESGVRDLLVLTGDSHSFWRNQLFDAGGAAMGVELGTTGVTSPGDFQEFGATGARLVDERLAQSNNEILWTDGRHNGFLRLTVEPEFARADFVVVSTILSTDYGISVLDSSVIERNAGSLAYRPSSAG